MLVLQSSPTLCDPLAVSVRFQRQEYWSGLPVPSPEDLPNPEIKLGSAALHADSLPLSHQGSQLNEVPRIVRFLETESTVVVLRGWGADENRALFNAYRVSVLQDGKCSGDGWWGCLHNCECT